jgi:methyltransferase (TIGR00027 family)
MTDMKAEPDSTAIRVALWRAMHVELDASPPVLNDVVGLELVAPPEDWRNRPDMHPEGTRPFRASIVARARFIEDLVTAELERNVQQYVLLGAGLDTFAQRRPDIASQLQIFEVDRPGPQLWKQQRLIELGFRIPDGMHFVAVDFEAGESWLQKLVANGFHHLSPAILAATGLSMYLSREAIAAMLREAASLAPGSSFAMSFLLPLEHTDPELRPSMERAAAGARTSGTPFISFFTPDDMLALAREAGFRQVRHISAEALTELYFADRTDGLRPPRNAEELLLATT